MGRYVELNPQVIFDFGQDFRLFQAENAATLRMTKNAVLCNISPRSRIFFCFLEYCLAGEIPKGFCFLPSFSPRYWEPKHPLGTTSVCKKWFGEPIWGLQRHNRHNRSVFLTVSVGCFPQPLKTAQSQFCFSLYRKDGGCNWQTRHQAQHIFNSKKGKGFMYEVEIFVDEFILMVGNVSLVLWIRYQFLIPLVPLFSDTVPLATPPPSQRPIDRMLCKEHGELQMGGGLT